MGRPGRPTKLTAELQEQFCALLRQGMFRRHAAEQVGVSEQSISEWFHRGARDTHGKHRDFFLAVGRAESDFAKTCLDQLQSMAVKDPKVVEWMLSRRFPELYGRKDNVEEKSPEDRATQAQATRSLLMERLSRLFPEPEATPAVEAEPAPAALPEATPDAVG